MPWVDFIGPYKSDMSTAIDYSEPTELTAGFSATWQREFSDYPNSAYSFSYSFVPPAGGESYSISSSASSSGNGFTITLAPANTALWKPGVYNVVGYVEDLATGGSTTRKQVFIGQISILANPTSSAGDTRSFAMRTRDALMDAIEKLAGKTLSSATVNGQSYTHANLPELEKMLDRYEQKVANEQGRNPRRIAIHFTGL